MNYDDFDLGTVCGSEYCWYIPYFETCTHIDLYMSSFIVIQLHKRLDLSHNQVWS